ncbi:MAG: type II secretion system F family protein [Paracoccaceae bacterium]
MIDLQSPELNYLIYAAIFLGFLIAFEGLRHLLSRSEDQNQAMNRRMRMIQKGATSDAVVDQLLGNYVSSKDTSLYARLSRLLKQSGLFISVRKFVLLVALFDAVLFAVAITRLPLHISVAFTLLVGVTAPLFLLSAIRSKRLAKLSMQLPDALDLMSRGLEVGHPLSVTVGNVASDMADPIGTEFGLIQDQISYGDDIVTSFASFADRVDVEDARYTSVSVGIQNGTGGNLAHVLRVLSKVIRDRAMMKKKIHAISAEGRLSATILSALPFVIMIIINTTSPSFYGDVKDDPILMYSGVAVLSLILLQAFILFRMVNFKF